MSAKHDGTNSPTAPHLAGLAGMRLPMAVGAASIQAWMDLGSEAVRFVRDRLQQDIETQQAMLGCTSLEELRKVQFRFLAAAREQYAAEAGKMLDLMVKATTAGLMATGRARRHDDVPL